MEYIAFDAHKRYTQVSVETADGQRRYEGRTAHTRGALQQFLTTCERGSPVGTTPQHETYECVRRPDDLRDLQGLRESRTGWRRI